MILKKNPEVNEFNQELITCCLSCLSNSIYYEKQKSGISTQTADFEFKNAKLELIAHISGYIMQPNYEEMCCEALRVLSNLSRQKELIK